jgi:O-antigen ligase
MIEAGVLFLLVFTPLAYGTVEPWSEAIAELVVLGMGLVWVLGMLRDWEVRIELPPGWLPAYLLVVLVFLQAWPLPSALVGVVSPWTLGLHQTAAAYVGGSSHLVPLSLAPHSTLREALKLGAVAAFFLVCYNAYRTRAQVRRALWTMMITGGAISLFGIVQRMTWNGRLYWIGPEAPHRQAFGPQAFGPFVNRAHFAGLATIIIAMAVTMLIGRGRPPRERSHPAFMSRWRSLFEGSLGVVLLVTMLLGGAVLIAGSRGGIIGLAATLLAMTVLAAGDRSRQRSVGLVVCVGGVILVAGAWMGFEIVVYTATRFASETVTWEGSMRILRWADTLKLIGQAPAVGTGLASFEGAFPVVRTIPYPARFTHAESDWVQMVSDTGIVGVVLAASAIGLLLWAGFRAWRASASPAERALRLGCLAAVIGTLVQAAPNYTLPVMSNQLYAALVASFLVASARGSGAR